jgi:hypothetical protein
MLMTSHEVKENKNNDNESQGLEEYLSQLYDVGKINDNELKLWNESYSYKGFDRNKTLIELMRKVGDIRTSQQIIMVCGLIGPQRASLTKLINGRTVASYGIPASGMKGSSGVSCQRITAATADLCAWLLKQINAPKRINSPLPGWLQFPGAGSIKLPNDLREAHVDFSRKFSVLIGGSFNEQIYMQMMNNAYLNEGLKLFDDIVIGSVLSQQQLILTPPPSSIPSPVKSVKAGQVFRKPP